jgi:uncharacterized protein YbcI
MTKGQIESQISEAIVKFEKDYMGRGPMETKSFIVKDMILVRLKGVLTPAEQQLSRTTEGADLIRKTRMRLIEGARGLLDGIVSGITGCKVRGLYSDVSIETGERVIVFALDRDLEERLP